MSASPWGNEKITVERVPDENMGRQASPWGNEKITVERVPDENMGRQASPWGNEKITRESVLDYNPNVHLKNAEDALRRRDYDEAREHIRYARSVANGNPEVEQQCKRVLDALPLTKEELKRKREKEQKKRREEQKKRREEQKRREEEQRQEEEQKRQKIKTLLAEEYIERAEQAMKQGLYEEAKEYVSKARTTSSNMRILTKTKDFSFNNAKEFIDKAEQAIQQGLYDVVEEYIRLAESFSQHYTIYNDILRIRKKIEEKKSNLEQAKKAIENGCYADADNQIKFVLENGNSQAKKEALKLFKDLENAKVEAAKKYLADAVKAIENGECTKAEEYIEKAGKLSKNGKITQAVGIVSKYLEKAKNIEKLLEQAGKAIYSKRDYESAGKILRYLKLKGNNRAKAEAEKLLLEIEKEKKMDRIFECAYKKISQGDCNGAEKYLPLLQSDNNNSRYSVLLNKLQERPEWHMEKAVSSFRKSQYDEAVGHAQEAWKCTKGFMEFMKCFNTALKRQSVSHTPYDRINRFNLAEFSFYAVQGLDMVLRELIDTLLDAVNFGKDNGEEKTGCVVSHLFILSVLFLLALPGFVRENFFIQMFAWVCALFCGSEGLSFYYDMKNPGERWRKEALFCYSRGFSAAFFLWLAARLAIHGSIMSVIMGIFASLLALAEVVILITARGKRR